MAATLHAHGIRLVVDIVPNHTSNRHVWFQEALASPKGSPARDRYIFRDGTGPGGAQPPSDWQSMFGGPAWTRVPDGQWYLHLFAPEQPDLNWDNPEVRDDFLDDPAVLVRPRRRRLPRRRRARLGEGSDRAAAVQATTLTDDLLLRGAHPFEDRDEVHEIYAEWRRVFNEYDPPRIGVAEAWVHTSRRSRYASPDRARPGVQLRPA